jgi:hypothetical protein
MYARNTDTVIFVWYLKERNSPSLVWIRIRPLKILFVLFIRGNILCPKPINLHVLHGEVIYRVTT